MGCLRVLGGRTTSTTALLVAAIVMTAWSSPASAAAVRRPRPAPAVGAVESCQRLLAKTSGGRTASPVALGAACPGVRPGAVLRLEPQGQCTFNYLFKGTDGTRYIGTAGHCALEGTGVAEKAWAKGKGPVARDGAGQRVGEFAYAVLKEPKDFALVRLDPAVAASPEVCHFGGPTRLHDATSGGGTVLQHFGQGVAIGDIVPARPELAGDLSDPDQVTSVGVAVPGDSGSPVQTADGGAVGVLVSTGVAAGVSERGLPVAGNITITRLAPQLAQASSVTGVRYTLQTAPLR